MTSMVSVVMATYNGEKFLQQQLESIANQVHVPDEVIISDDGSSDHTVEIAESFIMEHSLEHWKVIRNDGEHGFYNNFFNALKRVTGDIIYLADQDDVWDLKKISVFDKIYQNEKDVMMIQSNIQFIDDFDKIIEVNELYHNRQLKNPIEELSLEDMCRFAGSGYTMSFRKLVLDEVFDGGFDKQEAVFEFHDVLLGLVAIAKGKCLLTRDVIDKHRLHANNVTQAKGKNYLSERTKKRQCEILQKRVDIFDELIPCCVTDEKRLYFRQCSFFAQQRLNFIMKFSFHKIKYLFKKRSLYANRKGLISDCLYSLGCEKILLAIYKKMCV